MFDKALMCLVAADAAVRVRFCTLRSVGRSAAFDEAGLERLRRVSARHAQTRARSRTGGLCAAKRLNHRSLMALCAALLNLSVK